MKTRFILAAALLTTITAPAMAQDWHRDRDWHGERARGWDRDRGGWNHDWRWRGRPYAFGGYVYPAGLGYRRWAIGAFLPGPLFGVNFYFNDYDRFGLAPPPYGLRWVRYGPDLLLVSVRSGRVIDVRYGLFG